MALEQLIQTDITKRVTALDNNAKNIFKLLKQREEAAHSTKLDKLEKADKLIDATISKIKDALDKIPQEILAIQAQCKDRSDKISAIRQKLEDIAKHIENKLA